MSEQICPRCEGVVEADATVCPHCRYILLGDEDTPDEQPDPEELLPDGSVLADDYRTVRMVGMGGAGIVYEARQISLQNMPVALKVLHPDLNEDENTINLLKKEVIIARELTHDNILKVYSLEKTEDRYFIVMEFVAGESFQSILDKSGKCSFEKAGAMLLQVCEALQYAHERGVIHLDVKPANVLVGRAGNVKLCDFGIARMAFSQTTMATQRIITGSVGYMPPEQYRGRKFVSHQSDIFALAATLYTCLTGEAPIGIIEPKGVPKSVLKGMSRKPADRFNSAHEFMRAFIDETGFQPPIAEAPPPITTLRVEGPLEPEPEAGAVVPKVPDLSAREKAPVMEPVPEAVEGDPVESPKKKIHPAAVAVLAVTVLVAAALIWGTRESNQAPELSLPTTRTEKVAGSPSLKEASVGKPQRHTTKAFRTVASAKRTAFVSIPPEEGRKVEADKATTEAVESALRKFVESLNFANGYEAYRYLAPALSKKLPLEQFVGDFLPSPRLWKIEKVEVGKRPDGKGIVATANLRVRDAHLEITKNMTGLFEMTTGKSGLRISGYTIR